MTEVAAGWKARPGSNLPCNPDLRQDVEVAAVGIQTRPVEAAVADPSPQIVVVATADAEQEAEQRREHRRW